MSSEIDGLKMEFTALRSEIVSRIELRSQIVLATLTLAGVVFSFGLNTPAIAFVFPIVATFLAAAWLQHDTRISELTAYLHDQVESKIPGLGWETYRRNRPRKGTRIFGVRLSVLSAGGVFIVIQWVALIIGFSKFSTFTTLEWILGSVALVFTLITILLVGNVRRVKRPATK